MLLAIVMGSLNADPLGIVGMTLDKYAIEELAGEGGFSCVYKAQHQIWQEPVAIKFFRALEDAKPELREQLLNDFIQEGRLMSKLSSRSAAIVQARDIGRIDLPSGEWVPYMVLEWLDGASLEQVLRKEKKLGVPVRSLAETMSLLEPVARALEVAHSMKVAHRDLKPANVMIMGDPREPGVSVKVLDFGIAKVMAAHHELQTQLQMTGNQMTAFTPHYGSPEQFSRKHGATGPWTDVYAMALILLEVMRGGVRALQGETFFELGIVTSDTSQRPTPRNLGLEVSGEAEAVFARALAVQPSDRYPSMGEFWAELHHCVFPGAAGWLGATSPNSRTPSIPEPSARTTVAVDRGDAALIAATETIASQPGLRTSDHTAPGESPTAAALAGSLPQDEGKRGPAAGMLAAAALVAVVAGTAFFMSRGGDESATQQAPLEGASDDRPAATGAPGSLTAAATATAAIGEPSASTEATSQPSATAIPEPSATAAAKAVPKTTSRPSTAKRPPTRTRATAKPTSAPPKTGSDAWDPSTFGGR